MRRLTPALMVAAAATLGLAAAPALASPGNSGGHRQDGTAHGGFDHVYVIMLENHSQSSVIGDQNAPFINRLADKYGTATRYYGVTHPSMPNYIAAVAGDNFGIQDDNDTVVHLDEPNLASQMTAAGIRWGAYMEDLPADKVDSYWPDESTKLYAKKHNPFVLFDSVTSSPSEMAKVKPYSALATDLNSPDAPQFVWISPNQCHDMHGGVKTTVPGHPETPCPYGSAKDDANDAALKQKADAFVQTAVTTIMHSRAWTPSSAIVVVTDENDYTGNTETGGWESADGCCGSPYIAAGDERISSTWPGGVYGGGLIPAVVVTGRGPRHVVDSTPYNHYSLLTTIEDNFGLDHLGHAGATSEGVVPMWTVFGQR